jgi:hypothetical protein
VFAANLNYKSKDDKGRIGWFGRDRVFGIFENNELGNTQVSSSPLYIGEYYEILYFSTERFLKLK